MDGAKNNQAEKLRIEQMRKTAFENIAANAALRLPTFKTMHENDGTFVIVGGGPSLLGALPEVARRQKNGQTIVAGNGANRLLREHGIVPDIAVFLDPQEVIANYVEDGECGHTQYYVASIVHPKLLSKLRNADVRFFHTEIPDEIGEQYRAEIDKWGIIPQSLGGYGHTVSLRSVNLGHLLGYRIFRMFGVDSSYTKGSGDHAYVNARSVEPGAMQVRFDGKMYTCSPWMVVQADDFKKYHLQFHNLGCSLKALGYGIIPDMSRYLDRKRAAWLIWKTAKEMAA